MPNRQYEKGVRFERKIVNEAREAGLLAFRSAGSHSPVDVVIVNEPMRKIYLIQCKHSKEKHKKLSKEFDKIESSYKVIWKVMRK